MGAQERTAFERLSAAERESGFIERRTGSAASFRRGSTDSWREEPTDAQVTRILADHGDARASLGYAAE